MDVPILTRKECTKGVPYSRNPVAKFIRTGVLVDGGVDSGPVAANRNPSSGSVVWLMGMPCNGKTSVAKLLEKRMLNAGIPAKRVSFDRLRKELVPTGTDAFSKDPEIKRAIYTRAIVVIREMAAEGTNILVDAGTSAEWLRRWVKRDVPNVFMVHLYCNVFTQLYREVKRSLTEEHAREKWILFKVYRDLFLRRKDEFPQPGVTYPFEFPFSADIHVNTLMGTPKTITEKLMEAIYALTGNQKSI